MNKLNNQFLNVVKPFNTSYGDRPWDEVLDFLKNHKNYNPNDFWGGADEDNNHFLSTIIMNFPEIASNIYPFWLDEIKDFKEDIFNRENDEGKVLLHILWEKCMGIHQNSRQYRYQFANSELPEMLESVALNTNPRHYTWLDGDSENKGSGIINEAMPLLGGEHHVAHLRKFLDAIIKHFPQKKNYSTDHWLDVTSADQIKPLLDYGLSFDDEVKVASGKMPAWEWVALKNNKLISKKNVHDLIESELKEEQISKFENLKNKIDSWVNDSGLVAENYRAKIGYVKKVLDKKGFDPWGLSSFEYLIKFRPDLTNMFFSELNNRKISNDEIKERFLSPDKMGYTICNRIFNHSNSADIFFDFLELRNIKPVFGFEGKGLLRDNMDSWRWHHLVISSIRNSNVSGTNVSQKKLDKLGKINPSLIFGDEQQQAKWVDFWENTFLEINKLEGLEKRIKSYANVQILAYNLNGHLWEEDESINKTLLSQLKFASYLKQGEPNIFDNEKKNQKINSSISSGLTDNPPPIYTPAMQSLLLNEKGFVFLKPSSSFYHPARLNEYCVRSSWISDYSKKSLKESVVIKPERKASKRKF